MSVDQLRREYHSEPLSAESMAEHPLVQFQAWLKDAVAAPELADPTAMVLSTVDPDGTPWQRIVLLKDLNEDGLVFYTNYNSRKAQAIAADNRVSALMPWNNLERQIIVGGRAHKLTAAESARYFLSRPRESRLAAWASHQSRPISARKVLMQQLAAMRTKFGEGDIPLPDFWGGYRIVPDAVEFWQGHEARLHDRFRYTRTGDDWHLEQLQP